jgi:hypothetical protein
MTENGTTGPNASTNADDINDGVGTYDVVILAEHEVSEADAAQIHGLHTGIVDQVVYHVLIPAEDAAARLEATMGTLGAGDMFAAPLVLDDSQLQAVEAEFRDEAERQLQASLTALGTGNFRALGRITSAAPVDALASSTKADDAREAIVLTSPHLVSEFFHLDWTSRARRKLGVPVLHLMEHELH